MQKFFDPVQMILSKHPYITLNIKSSQVLELDEWGLIFFNNAVTIYMVNVNKLHNHKVLFNNELLWDSANKRLVGIDERDLKYN